MEDIDEKGAEEAAEEKPVESWVVPLGSEYSLWADQAPYDRRVEKHAVTRASPGAVRGSALMAYAVHGG